MVVFWSVLVFLSIVAIIHTIVRINKKKIYKRINDLDDEDFIELSKSLSKKNKQILMKLRSR